MINTKFIIFIITAFLASLLRVIIDNIILTFIIGSFVYGYVIGSSINNNKKDILLIGFCSCFTSFSAFINFLFGLINQGFYLKFFLYANSIVIFNLIIMFFAFSISRKIN